jgi:uncharacterized protein YjbJ (UPF0337 family)
MEIHHGLEPSEGNWKEFQGKVKEKWGKLTDDDLTAINGKHDQLEGRLQQRYGFAKDQFARTLIVGFLPSSKLLIEAGALNRLAKN